MAQAEEHLQKLQVVVKERDELKIQVKLRAGERDLVSTQFDTFRKSIKDLMKAEYAAFMAWVQGRLPQGPSREPAGRIVCRRPPVRR